MIVINYTTKGTAFKDFEVEETLRKIVKENKDCVLDVATINIIEMARALVAEEAIAEDNIIFKHEGKLEIKCSKNGKITCEDGIPLEYDFFEDCLDRIMNSF